VLYGQAYSVQYDNSLTTWSTSGDQGFDLYRAIFILTLLPTLLFLFGVVLEIVVFLKSIFKRDIVLATTTYYGLNLAAFIGFILFLCIYLFLFINLPIMKVIFIFPALVFTYSLFFMRAVEFIDEKFKNRFRWVRTIFTVWIVTLFILYAADIITMIQLLFSRRMGL
jgi:hypothetical protein